MDLSIIVERVEKLCLEKSIDKRIYTKSGAGKDFMSNIKKGSAPSVEKVFAVANYLDCSVDYLLGRTDNPQSHKQKSANTVNGNYNAVDNSSVTVNGSTLDDHQKLLLELYCKLSPIEQVELIASLNKKSK